MSADDYAILIGINLYPTLGTGRTSANLYGPENDVDAVRAWLMRPDGGGITDRTHIWEIKSATVAPSATGTPTADELEVMVAQVDALAQAKVSNKKPARVGRRLYIFVSGHGYSPKPRLGCLISANALDNLVYSVHITGWLNAFQDAGYFREYVLWMDCCMNRISVLPLRDPPLPQRPSSETSGANFIAFAAQRPLRTVEVPIPQDGGKYHGVFTWALMEGLRGAASDINGLVTGRSLADWIRNAQSARLSPQDRSDVGVAKEPEVIQEDAQIIFARGVKKPLYEVSLSFDAAVKNTQARFWSGATPGKYQSLKLGATPSPMTLMLEPGLYLIEVKACKLRHGFEVVGACSVSISEQGDPVNTGAAGHIFQLDIDPEDPTAEIFVIDNRFSLVDTYPGKLSTPLPFGLYKIKTRIGRTVTHRVILHDRDRPKIPVESIALPVATVIPIKGTSNVQACHEEAKIRGVKSMQTLGQQGHSCALLLMARAFSCQFDPRSGTTPWRGVSIVDESGQIVIDLEQHADSQQTCPGDPYAMAVSPIEPGTYFLRQTLENGSVIEQSLVACEGWGLEVYVLRRIRKEDGVVDERPRVAMMMRRLGDPPDFSLDQLSETLRLAFADERKILNEQLESLVFADGANPIAGIMGGHLLLIERERDPGRDISLLDTLVKRLREQVGHQHPDVEALALQCFDSALRRVGMMHSPPLFQRSWMLLAEASQRRRQLIPAVVWERVQAIATLAPFLTWSTDEHVRTQVREELSKVVIGDQEQRILEQAAAIAQRLASVVGPLQEQELDLGHYMQTAALRTGRGGKLARLAGQRMARALGVPQAGLEALNKKEEGET